MEAPCTARSTPKPCTHVRVLLLRTRKALPIRTALGHAQLNVDDLGLMRGAQQLL